MSNAVHWRKYAEKDPDNFVIVGALSPSISRRINDLGIYSEKRELARKTKNKLLMLECAAWYTERKMYSTARECQAEAERMK